ncbi:MAG: hypothetical protein GY824_09510 [Delftia sp.]|nr:hypothetical protein [Delftia sp.]
MLSARSADLFLSQDGLGLFGQKIRVFVNICLTGCVGVVYVFSVLPTTLTLVSHTLKFDQKLANFGVKVQKRIDFILLPGTAQHEEL